jgi:hypothetical protein
VPELVAGGEVEGVQVAVGPEGEDAVLRAQRGRPRAVVEPELVAVLRRVAEGPLLLARGRVEAGDDLLGADAVEDDELFADDDRPGPPGADVHLPRDRRPVLRPVPVQPRLGGVAVAGRAEELGPVGGAEGQRQGECQ